MIIGIPKEIKKHEYRVSVTTNGVYTLVSEGHKVLVEKDAGIGSGFKNRDYKKAGAIIVDNKKKLFEESDLIVKVKEPLPDEFGLIKEGTALFTYLHLASNPELLKFLCEKK